MSGSAEELLRSALEKIVFFECKVASLESELGAMRAQAVRAREEAGAARRRETELERAVAQARGEQAAVVAQNGELSERVRLLEEERERFLVGMVESARVAGAPGGEGEDAGCENDLAAFISELRAEIETFRAWKRTAQAAGLTLEGAAQGPTADEKEAPREAPTPLPTIASRFEAAGRIGLSPEEAAALPSFSTRTERVLYETALADLGSPDAAIRRRAANGLRALGSKGAAPLLARALGRETEADVKVALLIALGALAEPGAADLALRELSDARPAVRTAALEAASALARGAVAPQLSAALADPSPLVRRRAAVLLGFTPGAAVDDALCIALADRDPGVARAAAVALAGRPSPRAQAALARALDHRHPEVRRAAARAVQRWSGESVDPSAPDSERRRAARRIAEKLLALSGAQLRSAITKVPFPSRENGARSPPPRPAARVEEPRVDLLAVQATVPAPAQRDSSLDSAALAEVRSALRGRTVDELAAMLARDRATVEASLRALVVQGKLVARGPRFLVS
ncbi:MAG TPA: HEAT repeat domain-containing protein [Anaeromyxobacteraceae bacterium]|nr:HEAT repeat domain-containing protein [Anaeromyxobacteraceae bacterium]